MMNKEIDKVAYVHLRDGQILITRSRGKDAYFIPGGKRETGETDEETLRREVLEELNVKILPSTINYMGTFRAQAHGHPEGVLVKMTCYDAEYEGQLSPTSEIEEVDWFNYADIDRVSYVDKIIFNHLKDAGKLV